MTVLLRGVLIAYVLVWAVLLVGCLRKRDFCPIFVDSRRTRQFWLASFIFVNPLLTLLYLVFGQIRSPQARPVRSVRDLAVVIAIVGFFVNVPGMTHLWMQPFLGHSVGTDVGVKAHLAAIEAKNNTSTTSVTSSGDNTRLACRRVAVIVEGHHPLLRRIRAELVEPLEKIPGVETVEIYYEGMFPTDGQRTPDIFIHLYLDRIDENLRPYCLKLGAEIGAEVGRMPLRSTHYYRDIQMPPLLEFNLQINMKHVSTTTGYESVRYTMAARNIAKDLSEQIARPLGQWRDKYGLLPELPNEVYGTYVPYEIPGPLQELEPVLLGSYAGLLAHNETYLEFMLAEDPVKPLEELRDAMTGMGWKELSSDWNAPNLDLRLQKDRRRLHIFQVRPREPLSGMVVTTQSSEERPAHLFGVADVQRFDDDELKTALDTFLVEPVPMKHLVLFERMFDKEQRERWFEILKNQPSHNVFATLRLAEMYERRDLPDKARETLVRAKTLLWAMREEDTYKSRLKQLAKKLGDETLATAPPTGADLRAAEFTEITLDKGSFEQEVGLDQPVTLFCFEGEDKPVTLTLTVRDSDDGANSFIAEYVERNIHGSAWGSHGGTRVQGRPWQAEISQDLNDDVSVACHIEQIDDGKRFRIAVTVGEALTSTKE